MSSRGNIIDGLGDEVAIITIAFMIICAFLGIWSSQIFSLSGILQWLGIWRANSQTAVNNQPVEGMQVTARRSYSADRCAICLHDLSLIVETNCGHLFCGPCLEHYFLLGNYILQPLTCPVCREQISMVFLCFTAEEAASQDETLVDERNSVRDIVLQYNRSHSGNPRTVFDYFRDLPILLRHLWQDFSSLGMIMRIRMLVGIVIGMIYLFVPTDLLPEAIFGGLGLLDDLLFLCVLAMIILNHYRNFVINHFVEYQ